MKTPEFLELVSAVNHLDHHQRSLLAATLTQLSDEPKVSELIETAFDIQGNGKTDRQLQNLRFIAIPAFVGDIAF